MRKSFLAKNYNPKNLKVTLGIIFKLWKLEKIRLNPTKGNKYLKKCPLGSSEIGINRGIIWCRLLYHRFDWLQISANPSTLTMA